MNKPSWQDYLLGLAKCVSKRTSDSQTGHGCVIVGPDHRIISTGCNGFPRKMKDDSALPNTRPEKYPWMLHAEENAISNANGPLEGGTAYITGKSCLHCMMLLWQNGVKKIVQKDGYGWTKDEAEAANRNLFLEQSGMEVIDIKPDLSWLVDMVLEDEELRAILMSRLKFTVKPAYNLDTSFETHVLVQQLDNPDKDTVPVMLSAGCCVPMKTTKEGLEKLKAINEGKRNPIVDEIPLGEPQICNLETVDVDRWLSENKDTVPALLLPCESIVPVRFRPSQPCSG